MSFLVASSTFAVTAQRHLWATTRRAAYVWGLLGLAACASSNPKTVPVGGETPTQGSRQVWAEQNGLALQTFDLNRDGKPDVFKYFKEAQSADAKNTKPAARKLVRKELDLNHDGIIDMTRIFDDAGAIQEESADLDFDGKPDETAFFAAGVLIRKELDVNYDGKIDIYKHYQAGELDHIQYSRLATGQIDTWEYYEKGKIDRIGVDTDGDGKVDRWDRMSQQQPVKKAEVEKAEAQEEQAAEQAPGAEPKPPSQLQKPLETSAK